MILDDIFGGFQWYRRWRGGKWDYASCPDGGWFRKPSRVWTAPPPEDYTADDGEVK